MELTIRATTVELPDLQDAEPLQELDSLGRPAGRVTAFKYGESVRQLNLDGQQLLDGRITELKLGRGTWRDLRLDSVEFTGCDLSGLVWDESKLTRVRFSNCKLLGAQLSGLSLENVAFERCKLDYAALTDVAARGPVIFNGCSLESATFSGCDISRALLDECTLKDTEFINGTYRGTDLRGNDLSSVQRVWSLKHAIVSRTQDYELAAALATGLELTYGEDLEDEGHRPAPRGRRAR